MGADSGGDEDERPAHQVTLPAFWLNRTEVTNEAYRACVAARACRPKSAEVVKRYPQFNGPRQPVSGVSWTERARLLRLEGQAAAPRRPSSSGPCAAMTPAATPGGTSVPRRSARSSRRAGPSRSAPVRLAAGPFGHDDLAGNVVGSGWRTSTTPSPTGAPAPAKGSPAPARRSSRSRTSCVARGSRASPAPTRSRPRAERAIRGGAYNYPWYGLPEIHEPGPPPRRLPGIPMLGLRCARDADK